MMCRAIGEIGRILQVLEMIQEGIAILILINKHRIMIEINPIENCGYSNFKLMYPDVKLLLYLLDF